MVRIWIDSSVSLFHLFRNDWRNWSMKYCLILLQLDLLVTENISFHFLHVVSIPCDLVTIENGSISINVSFNNNFIIDMMIMAYCIDVMDTNIWQSRIQYIKSSSFSLEVCCTLCTFPIVVIFSVVVCLRCLYYHILSSITYISREHWDLVSIIDVQSMVFANDRIHCGL